MKTWKNHIALMGAMILSLLIIFPAPAQEQTEPESVAEAVGNAAENVVETAAELANETEEDIENAIQDAEEMIEGTLVVEPGEPTIDEKINAFMEPITRSFTSIVFWKIHLRELDLEGEKKFGIAWQRGGNEEGHASGLHLSIPFLDDKNPDKINIISFPFVLVWLLGAGIWATLFFGFPNLRLFGLAIKTVRGKYSDPSNAGEVSHFKALTTALSATVGLGNIAGVAVALSIGGPGAIVWMVIAGFIGMSSKFVECTLGVKFRQIDENGKVHGGPMYYLSEGFRRLGLGEIGTLLGGIFALMCIGGAMGGGNIFQVGNATDQIVGFLSNNNLAGGSEGYLANNRWVIGAIFAAIIGLVIIGGLVWIANVTSFVVPFMCGIYVISALIIIGSNITEIPAAISAIFTGAFLRVDPDVVTGGVIGAIIAGFQRAAFSNEAGIGSAAIAHSGVKTNHPASEGVVALLEPFIDTVVVCTMTALVIVISLGSDLPFTNAAGDELQGIAITTEAFRHNYQWMGHILTLAAVLFAFSTMISWCYYGMQSWSFLFGKSKISTLIYKFIFLTFIIIGSSLSLTQVVDISDAMIFAMAFPNVFAIIFFSPMVREELRNYLAFVWEKEESGSSGDEGGDSAPSGGEPTGGLPASPAPDNS